MKMAQITPRISGFRIGLLCVLLFAGALAGCTATEQGMGIGAGTGAVAGGLIGSASGHTTEGALIGAGVGAVGCGLIGEHEDMEHHRNYH